MSRYLFAIGLSLSLITPAAFAVAAVFTGRMEQAQTVTGQFAWRCEYEFAGQKFWKVFRTHCPGIIEVE